MIARWIIAAKVLLLVFLAVSPNAGSAEMFHLGNMNTLEYRSLDRDRTVLILPIGVIEEHGPYLPLLTDSYLVEWLADRVGKAIARNTDWNVVSVPSLPIGVGAPEDFGPRERFGSIPLRPETKRAVLMDLVSGFGDSGFRWVFVIDIHGPLVNKRITDEVSRYFEDTYGGTMLNLTGVVDSNAPATPRKLSEVDQKEDGLAVHAGLLETSWLMYVRPDLVRGDHVDAPPVTPKTWEDYSSLPNDEQWPGYFGSPRRAGAAVGGDWMEAWALNAADLAVRVIKGFDHRTLSRLSEGDNPALRRLDDLINQNAAGMEKKQDGWLKANGL